MEGIRLIDASEVHVKKKTSKIEIKKMPKIPINIIDDKNITESVGIRESDKGSEVDDKNILKKESDQNNKSVQDNVGMEIRAIKLKQEISSNHVKPNFLYNLMNLFLLTFFGP